VARPGGASRRPWATLDTWFTRGCRARILRERARPRGAAQEVIGLRWDARSFGKLPSAQPCCKPEQASFHAGNVAPRRGLEPLPDEDSNGCPPPDRGATARRRVGGDLRAALPPRVPAPRRGAPATPSPGSATGRRPIARANPTAHKTRTGFRTLRPTGHPTRIPSSNAGVEAYGRSV